MFKTSKKYHYFEEEKGIPQDYNNMMGTPIDESWTENPFPTEEDESNYLKGLLGKTEEVWTPDGWIDRPVRTPNTTESKYKKLIEERGVDK